MAVTWTEPDIESGMLYRTRVPPIVFWRDIGIASGLELLPYQLTHSHPITSIIATPRKSCPNLISAHFVISAMPMAKLFLNSPQQHKSLGSLPAPLRSCLSVRPSACTTWPVMVCIRQIPWLLVAQVHSGEKKTKKHLQTCKYTWMYTDWWRLVNLYFLS